MSWVPAADQVLTLTELKTILKKAVEGKDQVITNLEKKLEMQVFRKFNRKSGQVKV